MRNVFDIVVQGCGGNPTCSGPFSLPGPNGGQSVPGGGSPSGSHGGNPTASENGPAPTVPPPTAGGGGSGHLPGSTSAARAPASFNVLNAMGVEKWLAENAVEWLGPGAWSLQELACVLLKFAREHHMSNSACLSLFRLLNDASGSYAKNKLPGSWHELEKMLKDVLVKADKWYEWTAGRLV